MSIIQEKYQEYVKYSEEVKAEWNRLRALDIEKKDYLHNQEHSCHPPEWFKQYFALTRSGILGENK